MQLQCNSDTDQGEETQLQSSSQEKEGQPWLEPPCIALEKNFPQGHQLHYLWAGPEPRQPNPWEDGLRTLTFHFVTAKVPCPLHLSFPDLMLLFFFSQSRQGKDSPVPLHCPCAIPLSDVHFPRPWKHSSVPACSSSCRALHGFPYPVVMTLQCLFHSPITTIAIVVMPMAIAPSLETLRTCLNVFLCGLTSVVPSNPHHSYGSMILARMGRPCLTLVSVRLSIAWNLSVQGGRRGTALQSGGWRWRNRPKAEERQKCRRAGVSPAPPSGQPAPGGMRAVVWPRRGRRLRRVARARGSSAGVAAGKGREAKSRRRPSPERVSELSAGAGSVSALGGAAAAPQVPEHPWAELPAGIAPQRSTQLWAPVGPKPSPGGPRLFGCPAAGSAWAWRPAQTAAGTKPVWCDQGVICSAWKQSWSRRWAG